jgi:hypothetical protein
MSDSTTPTTAEEPKQFVPVLAHLATRHADTRAALTDPLMLPLAFFDDRASLMSLKLAVKEAQYLACELAEFIDAIVEAIEPTPTE